MVDHGLVPHPLHRIIVFNQRVQSERSYSASGGCPSGCPSQPEQLLLKVRISFPVCHRFWILTSYHHLLCLGGREDDSARSLALQHGQSKKTLKLRSSRIVLGCMGGREDGSARTLGPIKCSLFQPEQLLQRCSACFCISDNTAPTSRLWLSSN